jgi:hypothetical protein
VDCPVPGWEVPPEGEDAVELGFGGATQAPTTTNTMMVIRKILLNALFIKEYC